MTGSAGHRAGGILDVPARSDAELALVCSGVVTPERSRPMPRFATIFPGPASWSSPRRSAASRLAGRQPRSGRAASPSPLARRALLAAYRPRVAGDGARRPPGNALVARRGGRPPRRGPGRRALRPVGRHPDLYREYGLDSMSIIDAAARVPPTSSQYLNRGRAISDWVHSLSDAKRPRLIGLGCFPSSAHRNERRPGLRELSSARRISARERPSGPGQLVPEARRGKMLV